MSKGIILCTSSNLYQVAIEEKIYSCTARGKFKKEKISPIPGDEVEITITEEQKQEGILEEVLPRKNEIYRPKMANLTAIILVISMKLPNPDILLLDKQLAFAESIGITPIICFNKIDLENEEEIRKLVTRYQIIGYPVFQTNGREKESLQDIKQYLKNDIYKSKEETLEETTIIALAGNSGVGKSTLFNQLLEQQVSQEGQISLKNKKGKNTTTTVQLYPLENNIYIADTPGFSTFDIQEIESKDLENYFSEFIAHIENCKYIGCTHLKEKDCGIKQAVEEGKISKERYENYCKIYEELKKKEENKW